MFAAVLDTNVLWPSLRRDFLLSLAFEGLYRPLWNDVILEELEYEEAKKLRGRGFDDDEAHQQASRLVATMSEHFGDALVLGWEQLTPVGLPDPDDEPVLAAAVVGGAGAVVTENLKHFPADEVPSHIRVVDAATFARDTVSVSPERAGSAIHQLAQRRAHGSVETVISTLEMTYGMQNAMALLRQVL